MRDSVEEADEEAEEDSVEGEEYDASFHQHPAGFDPLSGAVGSE